MLSRVSFVLLAAAALLRCGTISEVDAGMNEAGGGLGGGTTLVGGGGGNGGGVVASGGGAATGGGSGGGLSTGGGVGGGTATGGGVGGGVVDAGTDAGAGCSGLRLCDDFEAYDAGRAPGGPWFTLRNRATLVVDGTRAFSGTKAIHLVTEAFDGGSAYRQALINARGAPTFPLPNNDLWGRMMLFVGNAPSASVHWTNIQGDGLVVDAGIADGGFATFRAFTRYGGQQQKRLMANYETSGLGSDCWQHSTTPIPEGRWACFEWHFDGPAQEMRLWVDGQAISPITIMGSGQGCVHPDLGNHWYVPRYDGVRLGWEHYQASVSHEVWLDDVAVDTRRIGCP